MISFARLSIAALFGCAAPALSLHAAEPPQTVHSFERTLTKAVGYKYLLALPTGYDVKSDQGWPLLLFLHGAGERGDDIWAVAKHGPAKLLQGDSHTGAAQPLAEHFIVASPQCPKGKFWDREALLALLDEIMATRRVDPTRVYLTGLSMGGFGTWDLGLAHPERFAAIAPICGGGQFEAVFMSNTHKPAELRSLGVWAFHGAKDDTVPLAETVRMVGLAKKFGVREVEFTVYPEAKHDSWTETYANPELYTWLLKHTRAATVKAK